MYEWGGWKRFIPEHLKDTPLEQQLTFWIESLEERAAGVAQLLALGWSMSVDCYFSTDTTETVALSAQLQKRFGALGIDVDIHFFAQESAERRT
ncbi:Hypothetical protein A7982_06096 [Minicystis rosea]|nr:Hypothetical protein A7982_06096 [Minicystis rosea]